MLSSGVSYEWQFIVADSDLMSRDVSIHTNLEKDGPLEMRASPVNAGSEIGFVYGDLTKKFSDGVAATDSVESLSEVEKVNWCCQMVELCQFASQDW